MKNTFVKVLSFLMALTMIVGTLGTVVVFAADEKCAHEPAGDPIDTVIATCESIGYTKYLCALCNKEYVDNVVPANKDHNFTKWVPAKAATCTEDGYKGGWVCADCGANSTLTDKPAPVKDKDALGHHFGTYVVKVAKTCTTNEYSANQCVRCDALDLEHKTEVPNTAGHEYEYEINTPATACISGKVTITCSDCDYKDVIVQTQSHHPVDMTTTDAATAEAIARGYVAGDDCGYTWKSGKYCDVCYEIIPGSTTPNNTQAHQSSPVAAITSTNLDEQLSNMTIPGTNNKFTVGSIVRVERTCTTNGWELNYCSDCEDYWIKIIAKPENGHAAASSLSWGEWKSTAVATTYANSYTAEYIQTHENHMYVFTAEKTCTNVLYGEGVNAVVCGHVVETRSTQAKGHDYTNSDENPDATVVVTLTCYRNGSVTYNCNYCDESHTDITAVAKRYHSYQADDANPVYVKHADYNCESYAKLVTTCTHEECDVNDSMDGKQAAVSAPIDDPNRDADHNYEREFVNGTCMTADTYRWKCTICGDTTKPYASDDIQPENAQKRPSNHVASYDIANGTPSRATATTLAPKQEYTCTTNQIKYFICECGERVELVTQKADGHNFVTGGVTESTPVLAEFGSHVAGASGCVATGACVEGCTYVSVEPVTPTCTTPGQKAGKICVDCGYIEITPEVLPVNPDAHYPATTSTTVTRVEPNCKNPGYTQYNCPGCFVKVTKPILNGGANNNTTAVADPNYHTNMSKVTAVAKNCVTPGKSEHYFCADCNGYYTTATAVAGATAKTFTTLTTNKKTASFFNVAGDANHEWSSVIELVYETCTDVGNIKFKFCKDCQDADTLTDYTTVKTVQIQDANLTVKMDDKTTETVNEAYNAIKIDAHGTKYTKDWSSLVKKDGNNEVVRATCTTGAWIAVPADPVVCIYCNLKADRTVTDKWVGTNATPTTYWEKPLDHKYPSDHDTMANASATTTTDRINYKNIGTVDVPNWVVADCTEASYVRTTCALCKETWLANYAPAVSTTGQHTFPTPDAEGNYATGVLQEREATCEEAGAYYVKCTATNCSGYLDVEVIPATGHYVESGSSVKTPISFECEYVEQYKGLTCSGCGLVVGGTGANAAPVEHNIVTTKVEKTCTEDGFEVKYCLDCNEKFDNNNRYDFAKGHDYQVDDGDKFVVANTASATTYRCLVCGENYDVPKTVTVPEATLSATVSAEAVKAGNAVAVAVKASAAKAISTLEFKVTYDASKFDLADIAVTVNAAYADKAVAFANVSGTNTVTVIVFVQNTTDGAEQTIDLTTAAELLTINFVAKKYANGESTAFTFETAVKLNEKATTATVTASKKVNVAGFGNVNGDALISVNDVKAVQGAIGSVNADLDFNGDGIVDIDDMNLIAKFVASAQTAKDYLVMIGVYAEIEAYVADMYATDNGYDFTNDNAMNNNDAYKLLKQVDTILNGYASYTAIDFDSVAEIVDQAVSALLN